MDQNNLRDLPTYDGGDQAAQLVTRRLDLTGSALGVATEQTEYVTISALPGLPAVPQKVVKKILGGEYIDMAELLPDAWRMEELMFTSQSAQTCPGAVRAANRKRPVTDILTWVECFSVLAAIVTAKCPERAGHLFAYQRSVVRASQLFEGPAWVSYDSQFRRKASLTGSWEWGVSDTALYNECFTGRAKTKQYCRICLSDGHMERHCPLATPTTGQPAPVMPTVPRPPFQQTEQEPNRRADRKVVELCGRFNKYTGNDCTFNDCRFAHICSRCLQGPHPASRCPGPRPTQSQGTRQRPERRLQSATPQAPAY